MSGTQSVGTWFQSAPPHGGRPPQGFTVGLSDVSIRAPARGATGALCPGLPTACSFNPRPRTGGDPTAAPHSTRSGCFNPRPRTGGDHSRRERCADVSRFNPRPRTGGDFRFIEAHHHPISFNPRPRTGGDGWARRHVRRCREVSIRAPARGATRRTINRGAETCFNPRPRTGGDFDPWYANRAAIKFPVSIRAPARGATQEESTDIAGKVDRFNPRPRTGGDDRSRLLMHADIRQLFQSAPPHGGRPVNLMHPDY